MRCAAGEGGGGGRDWWATEREATHHGLRGAWRRVFLIPPLDVRLRHCYNYQCGVEERFGRGWPSGMQ